MSNLWYSPLLIQFRANWHGTQLTFVCNLHVTKQNITSGVLKHHWLSEVKGHPTNQAALNNPANALSFIFPFQHQSNIKEIKR